MSLFQMLEIVALGTPVGGDEMDDGDSGMP